MRLPADAVLLIIDAQAVGDPRHDADDGLEVEKAIAAIVAAWRAEALPLAHVGRQTIVPAIPPLDGEIVIVRNATSAFVGADLEASLDELGATTLVLCGALGTQGLEAWVGGGGAGAPPGPAAAPPHAADLGYQVFVVADACRAADTVDLRGRLWPAEDVRALALSRLKGETATIVDVATTLRAAATAKARQRRAAGRG
jgi:nicotinamidase-related amidase